MQMQKTKVAVLTDVNDKHRWKMGWTWRMQGGEGCTKNRADCILHELTDINFKKTQWNKSYRVLSLIGTDDAMTTRWQYM